jgi:hypothetical protein
MPCATRSAELRTLPALRRLRVGMGRVRDVPRVWTRGRNHARRAPYSAGYPWWRALRGQSRERRNRESVAGRNHPHRLNPYSSLPTSMGTTVDAVCATRSTRWWKPPAPGTSWRLRTWPDSRSRIRTPRRRHPVSVANQAAALILAARRFSYALVPVTLVNMQRQTKTPL